jgi:hypothetical protein
MEATFSSETSVDFQRTTLRFIPENRTLHNHRCENLISYISNKMCFYRQKALHVHINLILSTYYTQNSMMTLKIETVGNIAQTATFGGAPFESQPRHHNTEVSILWLTQSFEKNPRILKLGHDRFSAHSQFITTVRYSIIYAFDSIAK